MNEANINWIDYSQQKPVQDGLYYVKFKSGESYRLNWRGNRGGFDCRQDMIAWWAPIN